MRKNTEKVKLIEKDRKKICFCLLLRRAAGFASKAPACETVVQQHFCVTLLAGRYL